MSIVIALIVVSVVGGLIAKFYPKAKQTTFLAPGETFTLEELAPESAVVVEFFDDKNTKETSNKSKKKHYHHSNKKSKKDKSPLSK